MNFLDRYFSITERRSTISRELWAGLTIFSAMAYILAVNPSIMASAGLPHGAMVITTVAGTVVGTLIMALWARLPIALAPAMSSNVLFAQVIVQGAHVSPFTGFTVVLVSGILFTLASLTSLRSKIIAQMPTAIIVGVQLAIGALIARIGFLSGGLAHAVPGGLKFGDLSQAPTLIALGATLIAFLLALRKCAWGALAIIFGVTILGLFVKTPDGAFITTLPAHLAEMPHYPTEFFLPFDFHDFLTHLGLLIPITLYALLSDFFDATGTLITVAKRAGLCGTPEHPELDNRAFACDGMASVTGVILGTCTVSAYVESATGVEIGGRTGLCAVVVAILFALAAFFWPLFAAIPALATAPILIMVGISIITHAAGELNKTAKNAFIPFLMLLITAVTGNFMIALAIGTILFTLTQAVMGKWKTLTPVLLGLNVAFICYMYLQSRL